MYRCAHCHNRHTLATEARACAGQFTPRQQLSTAPASPPPVRYGKELDNKLTFLGELLINLDNGRYAATLDTDENLVFLRVSRPKKGRLEGAIKIQTQHGDELKDCFTVRPPAGWSVYQHHRIHHLIQILGIVLVDPLRAGLTYGRKIERCCRCGIHLTDPRSRHYGIGPECEKYWPNIIHEVDQLVEEGKI